MLRKNNFIIGKLKPREDIMIALFGLDGFHLET
jgi:hypothetical protein